MEIKLKGDDFVAYNISGEISWPSTKHSLWFDFKTVEPNGLLVYIGSEVEHKDFVMVDLVHGKLRYDVNFTLSYFTTLHEVDSNFNAFLVHLGRFNFCDS